MNDNLVSRIDMRRAVQKAFRIYQVLVQSSQLIEKASTYTPVDNAIRRKNDLSFIVICQFCQQGCLMPLFPDKLDILALTVLL